MYRPAEAGSSQAEVKLDYVGSLENAAVVISRLHRGEKRLVFVDSRARAEELGAGLRQLGVTAFVTHSSLSQEQRRQAEDAFANRDDCVIVATSVLELGIDVGNLDRVIQIDSPTTVSSFLQRMGRTGRRPGTIRNCLFLATRDETLVQAAGLIDLWHEGYVEPIQPPAGALPRPGPAAHGPGASGTAGSAGTPGWSGSRACRRSPSMPAERIQEVVAWMLAQGMLWEEQGILGIGQKGEETYGRRHFLELLSVFLSPPLFAVLHGRQELGFVDELTFLGKQDGPRVLLLGGRAWRVTHIDWQRKVAHVEVSEDRGRTRWKGAGPGAVLPALPGDQAGSGGGRDRPWWSQRARTQIEEVRGKFPWVTAEGTAVVGDRRRRGVVDLRRPAKPTQPWPRRWPTSPRCRRPATTWPSSSSGPCRWTPCSGRSRNSGPVRPRHAAARGQPRGPGGHEVLRLPAAGAGGSRAGHADPGPDGRGACAADAGPAGVELRGNRPIRTDQRREIRLEKVPPLIPPQMNEICIWLKRCRKMVKT